MNKIKEWLSDYLRYILLVFAAILLIVIAFFAVRLVTGIGSDPKKSEPQTELTTEKSADKVEKPVADQKLQRDVPDIANLVTRYYNARAEKNFETLASICEVFDDNTKSMVEKQDAAVESYSNIITYSKAGMKENEYVVYTYFEVKLTGIDTLAPSLRELYLITNDEGQLVVADQSDARQSFLEKTRADDDVQALRKDVDDRLNEAKEADEDLKSFVESSTVNVVEDQNTPETQGEEANAAGTVGADSGKMQATVEVNVRGSASTDGTLYGVLTTGTTVEVLENLDSGWSKIRYSSNGSTIEGYCMTQYLAPAQ